jgi:hypothetical protein
MQNNSEPIKSSWTTETVVETKIQRRTLDRIETLNVLATLPGTAHLNPQEAALYIGTSADVLRAWRSTGKGPKFKGRGHFIRYVKSDLDQFMSAHDRDTDSPAA